MRGVPRGYTHNWKYTGHWKEKKTGPGSWKFRFKATKRTNAKAMGPEPGSRVKWKINGVQSVVKTGKGKYKTDFIGKKKLVSSDIKTSKGFY